VAILKIRLLPFNVFEENLSIDLTHDGTYPPHVLLEIHCGSKCFPVQFDDQTLPSTLGHLHPVLFTTVCSIFSFQAAADNSWEKAENIYAFSAKDIEGNEVSLDKYK
jgi:hypothetical protein